MSNKVKTNTCVELTVGGVTHALHEGKTLKDVVYTFNDREFTVSGKLDSFNVIATRFYRNYRHVMNDSFRPNAYFNKIVTVIGMTLILADNKKLAIELDDVVSIGEVTDEPLEPIQPQKPVISMPADTDVVEFINTVEAGSKVSIPAGTHEFTTLSLDKSVTIVGANDRPQNSLVSTFAAADTTEATVLAGQINVDGADAEVEFRGVTFSNSAVIKVTNASSLKIVNCRMEGIVPSVAKTQLIHINNMETPIKLTIEGCYFGDNPANGSNKTYNGLELYTKLADGSSISNNLWSEGCLTHNQINIYGADDNATIKIANNHAVKSANLIRIGTIEDAHCTINVLNNSYDVSDEAYPDYAGLLLIQPYGERTTSMANVTINVNDTVRPNADEQLLYLYSGSSDMKFDDTNKPVIYVDNVLVENPPMIQE